MKIVFAGVTLADPDGYPPSGVTVNGQLVYESVQLVAAAQQKLYSRGNELVTLQFSSSREFASLREAGRFLLGQFTALPKTGTCVVTVGQGEDVEDVTLSNALLTAVPQITQTGVRITTQYTVLAPGVVLGSPIDELRGGATMLRGGSEAITSGASSVSVVFAAPFPTSPAVTVSVSKPSGGDNIWATVRGDLTSVDGFTAELSGPVPATGYFLTWNAVG